MFVVTAGMTGVGLSSYYAERTVRARENRVYRAA